MKPKLIRISLTLLACLMLSVTASGQCSIHDKTCAKNCIVYTEKQDVRCLQCLINEPLKDSIIKAQIEAQNVLRLYVDTMAMELAKCEGEKVAISGQLDRMRKRKNKAYFIGGSVAVILETILILLVK